MNCDQTYDALCTPQFNRVHASEIKRHLSHCTHCQALAAELQPALQLLNEPPRHTPHEAQRQEEAPQVGGDGAKPWLNGEAPDPILPGIQPAPVRQRNNTKRRTSQALSPGVKFWQVTSLALLLALAVTAFQAPFHVTPPARAVPVKNARFQPDEAGREQLAGMNLPGDCLGGDPAIRLAGDPESAALQCCTSCHAAGSPKQPALNVVAMLDSSCRACHQSH